MSSSVEEMDDEAARKIQGIARAMAKKWGRPEIAEDLAQDAIIQQLRWPGLDIEYALINLLRQEYGNSRTPGGRARQIGTDRAIRLDAPVGEDQGENSTLGHECVGDPRPDPRSVEPPRDFSYLFKGCPERTGKRGRPAQAWLRPALYRLVFQEEMTVTEAAKLLGIRPDRASLVCTEIRSRILIEAGMEEVREKLAEDPGITEVEIDWITL